MEFRAVDILLLPFNLRTMFDIRAMQSVSPTEQRSISCAKNKRNITKKRCKKLCAESFAKRK